MVVFGKVVVFGQSSLIRAKVVVFGLKWLYSGKSGCIRAKVVVFGQKLLYFGKVVVFVEKLLYSGKVDVFGENGCVWAIWLCSVKSSCIRAK